MTTHTETPFTLLDACTRAVQAVGSGIVPKDMGNAFASWLADTYRDDFAEYVDGLDTTTLFGRFLAATEGGRK